MYYPQEIGRNISEILRAVKALQVADANKVSMPANWPNNELIGDKVIVPMTPTEQGVKERVEQAKNKEIECYDWWLCYRKL